MTRASLFIVILSLFQIAWSQQEPLTHEVYSEWNTIPTRKISYDGKWVVCEVKQQEGNSRLVVHRSREQVYEFERATKPTFSADSKFLIATIEPDADSIRALKRKKVKKDKLPPDTLLVVNLENGDIDKVGGLEKRYVPDKWSGWIAYQYKLPKPETPADSTDVEEQEEEIEDRWLDFAAEEGKDKKKKSKHNPLVIESLSGADSLFVPHVSHVVWAKERSVFLLATDGDSTLMPGIYRVALPSLELKSLIVDTLTIGQLTLDWDGKQSAMVITRDTAEKQPKVYRLAYWESGMEEADLRIDTNHTGMANGWMVNPDGKLEFSQDGNRLFLETKPIPPSNDSDSLGDFEKPKVDVWSWTDDELQPKQLTELKERKEKGYLAIYTPGKNDLVQLANEQMDRVSLPHEGMGDFAMGVSEDAYEKQQSWEFPWRRDVFAVDLKDGSRSLIAKEIGFSYELSPSGRFAVWYNDRDTTWQLYDLKKEVQRTLAGDTEVDWYRVDHDAPYPAPAYGSPGFTEGETHVILYDQYDIWAAPVDGGKLVPVTGGQGSTSTTEYRYVNLDRENPYVPVKSMMLRFQDQTTMASGLARTDLMSSTIRELVRADVQFWGIRKADSAEQYVFTRESYSEFPDLWITDGTFTDAKKLSDANPQQTEYAWGSVELTSWVDFDGDTLDGLIYLPAGFSADSSYPMLVYYYEKLSDNLHRHYIPSPSRSVINPAMYTSNGYVVFMPDIPYDIGHPGRSAYDAIMSGTQHMLSKGYVDVGRMGLQGQSWGGYQTAYMVTQTNLFKAAMAGAPVSNMFSAYGGIRWGAGLSRMFQYERTQSRIGSTIWENPYLYIENSPLFHVPRIETPLLIMHNDDDGAVPWYQGIELFVAMRRLNKPVWMLNYNGDKHNLTKWPNRVDLSIRMQQFFDHYLMGKPAPPWMTKGVPAIDKGRVLGY